MQIAVYTCIADAADSCPREPSRRHAGRALAAAEAPASLILSCLNDKAGPPLLSAGHRGLAFRLANELSSWRLAVARGLQ